MVDIGTKYKIEAKRFGFINWIGTWTLYKKEVLRFLIVWAQTIFSPLKEMVSQFKQNLFSVLNIVFPSLS